MRYLLTIAVLFSVALPACCQEVDLDHLMKKKFLGCHDIALNCHTLIPQYLQNEQYDSVALVLAYWEKRCPSNGDQLITKILFNIASNKFSEADYKEELLPAILEYKTAMEREGQGYYTMFNDDLSRYYETVKQYHEFLGSYAREVKAGTRSNSLEYLLCGFFDQDFEPLLSALKNDSLPQTYLQQSFNREKARLDDLAEYHMSLVGEYWSPMGKAKLLGNHGGAGFQIGLKHKKFMADVTFIARFGDAKNPYSINERDSLYTTDHFSGTYMGLDVGNVIFTRKNSEFAVLGGIAYDVITAVPYDEEKDIEGVSVGTINLNAGAGYRYYYNSRRAYLGLQGRYNVVDYFTKGGTDLSGHTISLRIIWGISQNPSRDYFLRRLGY
jgi:hypothetical protein